jgi:hypothetical protein
MIFLIEYDRNQGTIVTFERFPDHQSARANEARLRLELNLNKRGIIHEVVLLEASSEADLRRTHRRYFETLSNLIEPAPA